MFEKELIFLEKFEFLPEEVKNNFLEKKYDNLPRKCQNSIIKEELLKWGIAMNYCGIDYTKYLISEIAKELTKEIFNIKKEAKLI